MSDLTRVLSVGLNALGATGLVNCEEPCGCGLDGLCPCDEPMAACGPAYAVLCDGTNCESCDGRPYPAPDDYQTVCFVAVEMMDVTP